MSEMQQSDPLPGPSKVEESTMFRELEKVEEKLEEKMEGKMEGCAACGQAKRKADKSCLQCMASDSEAHSSQHQELHSGKRHKADPGDASSPRCPLDGAVALQEDSSAPSSGIVKMFESHSHDRKVLEGLNRLRLNGTLCDVILCCEGQEFPCHRVVLASVSSYFKAMFMESTQDRVNISGLEPQAIDMLVSYVYTYKVSITTANVQALLAASNLWDVTDVRRACHDFMKRNADTNNCADPEKAISSHKGTLDRGDGFLVFREDSTSAMKTERFVAYDHSKMVFNRLRLNTTLHDVILCCEGQEFPCHRAVLASVSSYFEAMFTSGMMESTQDRVTIGGLEPQTIDMLVSYVYTSEVSITTANVQALLAASNLWDVSAVREACSDYMSRNIPVQLENCVEMYYIAEAYSVKKLKKRSMDCILEHFTEVYRQEEFLSLPVDSLAEMLSSDHLSVPKEDMVFDAAMLWLDQCPTRKHSFDKVLEQVRLPLLSPSYLQHVVESLEVVKDQQGCQSFISEAKEPPCSKTARPRRITVIVMMGGETGDTDGDVGCRDTEFSLLESFNPLTSTWNMLGVMPWETCGYAVVISGSALYLAGGLIHPLGSSMKWLWRYDVDHDSWKRMADMNEARAYFKLVVLGGHVFAVGGRGSEKSEDSIERYDRRSNAWHLMESVGVAAYSDSRGPAVVSLDGLLYFIGGALKPNPPQVAQYNPETSVWTDVAPMQIPRDQPAVCTLNGKIYLIGGRHYNTMACRVITENTMECFNPATNQWTMCANMQDRRYLHSAVVADGKIYYLGGRDEEDAYPRKIERYCEETNAWETVGRMTSDLRCHPKCVSLRLRNDHDKYRVEDDHNDHHDDHDSSDYHDDDEDVDDRHYGFHPDGGFYGKYGTPFYEMDRYG